jgi:hypothetical protein
VRRSGEHGMPHVLGDGSLWVVFVTAGRRGTADVWPASPRAPSDGRSQERRLGPTLHSRGLQGPLLVSAELGGTQWAVVVVLCHIDVSQGRASSVWGLFIVGPPKGLRGEGTPVE